MSGSTPRGPLPEHVELQLEADREKRASKEKKLRRKQLIFPSVLLILSWLAFMGYALGAA